MQRDMDLVRKILFRLEEHEHGAAPMPFAIDGYSNEQIGFHVRIMDEAGLVRAFDDTPHDFQTWQSSPQSITWEGYEFLEASRSEELWDRAKRAFNTAAVGVPLSMLKTVLVCYMKEKLGIDKE